MMLLMCICNDTGFVFWLENKSFSSLETHPNSRAAEPKMRGPKQSEKLARSRFHSHSTHKKTVSLPLHVAVKVFSTMYLSTSWIAARKETE